MQITLESLRQLYQSLSDEELLAVERNELTEAAQKCFDAEVEKRGLAEVQESDEEALQGTIFTAGVEPDWMEDAACACSFTSHPGGSAASDADKAQAALQGAGIPCHISAMEVEPPPGDAPVQHEYRVMVPGGLNLEAASTLDKEVFNPQLEGDWRTHFSSMTDEELGALNLDVICAGLADRIARLKRAYNDEISQRFRRSAG